jgi:DNA-binding response OmpR family regulator
MGSQGTVLIVEDDHNTAALVAAYLEREGFSTTVVHDGGEAIKTAGSCQPVFVILDVMLPNVDGWEICRTLRRTTDVPIIMLTAREEELDRVSGLAMGADDYVVKPFSPRELVERVKAILRRSRPASPRSTVIRSFGGLELDAEKHRVTRNGRLVSLTSSEYKILHALMSSPGKAFSREELLNHCYRHGEAVIDRVIDVHVGKLRQKIEDDPSNPRYILTVRGHGYQFSDESGIQGDI